MLNFIAEEELRCRVTRSLPEFIELTNWEYLAPHLVSVDLLDPAATDYLLNETRTEHQKGVYFYLKVLPSKGPDAYTRLYKCLCDEKKHSGHKSLLHFLSFDIPRYWYVYMWDVQLYFDVTAKHEVVKPSVKICQMCSSFFFFIYVKDLLLKHN